MPVAQREGIIPPGDRGANGYRDDPAELVTLLRVIEQAQGLGFTLREIADVEIDTGEYIVACTDARALLAKKHAAVTALIAEAEDRKRRIEALMAELEASRQKRITVGTA
ncbi:MAG: MerR family DNA-binding protein [Rhodobacter sp.]|nr:MerR family DNA-binding protein [Rhodobacter sp.]